MTTTHILPLLLVCPPLRLPLAIFHHCFQTFNLISWSPLFNIMYPGVGEYGGKLSQPSFCTAEQNKRFANHHRYSAPSNQVNQKVWLSTRDIKLEDMPRKLALRYIGPFPVERIFNTSGVRLKLSPSLHIHPIFHVSQIKPMSESPLSPPTKSPPPARIIDHHPAYTVNRILDVCRRGRGF